MIDIEWDKDALTNDDSITPSWTFVQIYTVLDGAWLQEQRQKLLSNDLDKSETNGIFWESQGV